MNRFSKGASFVAILFFFPLILNGKLVFQVDARDILRNLQNEVFTMNSDKRGFKIYGGGASYILGRLMIII